MNEKYLTDQLDWETTHNKKSRIIENIEFSKLFHKFLKRSKGYAIEIGCVPGDFIIYICKKFGYVPVGIDYLKDTKKIMADSFNINGFNKYEIYQEDFFKWKNKKKFDLVSSFGFIEHFTNTEEVIKKHIDILNNHGILILEVPNFLGFRNIIAKLIDKEFYYKHNIETMKLDFYKKISIKYDLQTIYLSYYGGFAYYPNNRKMNLAQKIIYLPIRAIGRFTRKIPQSNWLLSSYLIYIAKKKK